MLYRIGISIMIVLNCFLFFKAAMLVFPFPGEETYKQKMLKGLQVAFDMNEPLASAFYLAYQVTDINPVLLACLAFTESTFKLDARSYAYPDKYKGIMQTTKADGDADIDVLRGAKHLKRNLVAHKDLKLALAYYKGGNNNEANKQADVVLKMYEAKKKIVDNIIYERGKL